MSDQRDGIFIAGPGGGRQEGDRVIQAPASSPGTAPGATSSAKVGTGATRNGRRLMSTGETLLAFSEWLDAEGLISGSQETGDSRTHAELTMAFFAHWEAGPNRAALAGWRQVFEPTQEDFDLECHLHQKAVDRASRANERAEKAEAERDQLRATVERMERKLRFAQAVEKSIREANDLYQAENQALRAAYARLSDSDPLASPEATEPMPRVGFRYQDGEILSLPRMLASKDDEIPEVVIDRGDGEWLTPFEIHAEATDADYDYDAAANGCDCTELCSMGPTCPGGSLAGLAGSGCWRTKATDAGGEG